MNYEKMLMIICIIILGGCGVVYFGVEKTKSITVKTYISYFQLSGGIRTYTEDDTVSCGITYKNHAKQ